MIALILLPVALAVVTLLIWRSGRAAGSPAAGSLARPAGLSQVASIATRAVQAAVEARVVAQLGMIAHIAVDAIGFVRALLKPETGSTLLEIEVDGRLIQMVSLNGRYVLDVGYQKEPPASYPQGAKVNLTQLAAPVRVDLSVEGVGLEVSEDGRSVLVVKPGENVQTSFKIRAARPGKTKLRIDCYHENAWFQTLDFELEIQPEEELARLSKGAETVGTTALSSLESGLSLPVPAPDPQPRHLHLSLAFAPDADTGTTYRARARAAGKEGWHKLDVRLREQDLRELNEGLRDVLKELSLAFGQAIQGGRNEIGPELYHDTLDRLASRGNAVFKRIFPNPADRGYLTNALSRAEDATLEISTDSFFLPWELLYEDYDSKSLDFRRFWGFRYRIARILTDVRDRQPPVLQSARPRVILFANPDLPSVKEKEVPFLTRLDLEQRIALHDGKREALVTDDLPLGQSRERFFEYSRTHPGELAHFACHAVGAANSLDSYLRLSDHLDVRLEDMEVAEYRMAGSPLVLLNACGTGVRDPLKTCDFVRSFLKGGGRGVVATECDVPDLFASTFIQHLYEGILRGEPVASALLASRRAFLADYDNPLGLLYSAYLPFETRLDKTA